MRRKILFVDIDGVLNSDNYAMYCHENNIDSRPLGYYSIFTPEAIKSIKYIIKETECLIVISSSWRGDMDSVYDAFKINGLETNMIIGRTEYDASRLRGKEIDSWIKSQGLEKYFCIYRYLEAMPKLEKELKDANLFSYCILEDEPSDLLYTQGDYLCDIGMKDGLQMHHAERAVEILIKGILQIQTEYCETFNK